MRKRIQLILLMVIALLQFVAPLTHAHVNGHSEDHHIHLAELDTHGSLLQVATGPSMTAEEDHSQVVSMQPEFRGKTFDMSLALPPQAHTVSPVPVAIMVASLQAAVSPHLKSPHYQLPLSQAPPA